MSDKNTTNDLLALSNIVGGLLASGHYTEIDERGREYRAIMFSKNLATGHAGVLFAPLAVVEGLDILDRMKFHLKMESAEEPCSFVFVGEKVNPDSVTEGVELLIRFEEHLKTKGVENFSYSDFLKMVSEKGVPFPDEDTCYALFEEWTKNPSTK